MLVRDKPFEELGIDFEEQLRLKEAEYAKLDRVIRYATSGRCRQLEILDYFGDPSKHACGTCDNCKASNVQASGGRQPPEGHASGDQASGGREAPGNIESREVETNREAHASRSPNVLNAVRMVLSGVARLKGRYGKQMVAKMLVGSKAKEMSRGGIDRLSTYGILSSLKESEALTLIDALLAVRLLMQVEETPRRPLVRLTPRGEEVMKGQAELTERLELHPRLIAKLEGVVRVENPSQSAPPAPHERNVPIEDSSPDDFDVANAELAADFEPDEPLPSPAKHAIHPPQANHQAQPPHYWTWRVLASGFSADECCQIRGLSADELHDQLLHAAQDGQPVDPRWVLTSAQIAALDKLISRIPARSLPEQLPTLPAGIQERQAKLYLLTRDQARRP
jgi:ATP-dependent DNA helicase RecQ